MPQVREPRQYEPNAHNNENGPAQPFGHRFLVRPWPTHEGRIECPPGKEGKYNPCDSHNYLNNPSCHECFSLATAGENGGDVCISAYTTADVAFADFSESADRS
jgi:hypothetical protein